MGIKHFDVSSLAKAQLINPKDVGYKDSIDIIYDELQRTRKSFVKIGWYLKHINEKEMYKEDGYLNIYEFAHDKFNISQPTATRFMNLCSEFSIGHNSPELDERYIDFSVSQLFEMLPMKPEEKELVTSDMTVKKIRQIKNESKRTKETADTDITDDNVPGQTSIERDFPEYLPDTCESASEENYLEAGNVIIAEEAEKDEKADVLEDNIKPKHDSAWFVEQYVMRNPIEAEIMFEICRNEVNNTVRAKAIKKYIAPYGYHGQHSSDYSYQFKTLSAGIYFDIGGEKSHMTYRLFVEGLMKLIDKESSKQNVENDEKCENELSDEMIDLTNELFDLIESLAIRDREKMPREEIEILKENALKLTVVIEKLLKIYN